ncbi:unnamed protein product, partial [Bubo scandiacus]
VRKPKENNVASIQALLIKQSTSSYTRNFKHFNILKKILTSRDWKRLELLQNIKDAPNIAVKILENELENSKLRAKEVEAEVPCSLHFLEWTRGPWQKLSVSQQCALAVETASSILGAIHRGTARTSGSAQHLHFIQILHPVLGPQYMKDISKLEFSRGSTSWPRAGAHTLQAEGEGPGLRILSYTFTSSSQKQ